MYLSASHGATSFLRIWGTVRRCGTLRQNVLAEVARFNCDSRMSEWAGKNSWKNTKTVPRGLLGDEPGTDHNGVRSRESGVANERRMSVNGIVVMCTSEQKNMEGLNQAFTCNFILVQPVVASAGLMSWSCVDCRFTLVPEVLISSLNELDSAPEARLFVTFRSRLSFCRFKERCIQKFACLECRIGLGFRWHLPSILEVYPASVLGYCRFYSRLQELDQRRVRRPRRGRQTMLSCSNWLPCGTWTYTASTRMTSAQAEDHWRSKKPLKGSTYQERNPSTTTVSGMWKPLWTRPSYLIIVMNIFVFA
jgi:hypothetical protein